VNLMNIPFQNEVEAIRSVAKQDLPEQMEKAFGRRAGCDGEVDHDLKVRALVLRERGASNDIKEIGAQAVGIVE